MNILMNNDSMLKTICLKIPKDWSENFKDEMLSVEEAWDDVVTGFQEMEDAVDWMKKAMQSFLKAFSEYEWIEEHAEIEVPDGQKNTNLR